MKKLVYHFFFYKDWRENKVYDIHFKCLDYYKDCFDEVYFALSFQNPSDVFDAEEKLSSIFGTTKKVTFEVVENSLLCEVPTFKREIIDKLGEDDLVFFAHSKGIMDVKKWDVNDVYKTICGLYYLSLEPERRDNEITEYLVRFTDVISYGSLMSTFTYKGNIKNKYEWFYAGTFFWINSKRLKHYIDINYIEIPDMFDRFSAENFLGDIYPISHFQNKEGVALSPIAMTYKYRYIVSYAPNILKTCDMINYVLEGEEEQFNEFKDLMVN